MQTPATQQGVQLRRASTAHAPNISHHVLRPQQILLFHPLLLADIKEEEDECKDAEEETTIAMSTLMHALGEN
jgi:hypothetical protein